MGFLRNVAGLVISTAFAALVGYCTGLERYAGMCLVVQWASALFYALPKQDERYFDLTGSITYAAVSRLAYVAGGDAVSWRGTLLTAFVWLWCMRLGLFLYSRIRECGEDKRFVEIRGNPLRFLSVWSIQGLWVFLTVLPVLLSLTQAEDDPQVRLLDIVGSCLWVVGYILEATADYQKTRFRHDDRNKGKFIQSGLWRYSRHPNYCGEIMMWVGVFCVAVHTLPSLALHCWAAVSPAFVTLLLLRVSGIPLLEKQADERWGKTKAYQDYKAQTSLLLPMPPSVQKTA